MRCTRPFLALVLACSSLASPGCGGGGGGGGGRPLLFPAAVTPQDLVAVAFEDASTLLPRLSLADVRGRGEALVEDLVIADGGVIDDLLWSPDHSRLAVRAQPDGVLDDVLYVVEPLTGTVTPVSGPQTPGTFVSDFAWAPDSTHLAFLRNQSGGDRLFVVGADGSGLVDVTGPAVAGGGAQGFQWAPDSSRVAVQGDLDLLGVAELFVVDRDGSGRVKVSGALAAGGGIFEFRWSPDSTRLALSGSLVTTAAAELFTVLADGSGSRLRVHPNLPAGGNVIRFDWAPNGARLAYVADQGANDLFELFSSLPDGTGNVKLSGTMVTGGDVEFAFLWAPDASRIAFAADRLTNDVRELFTAPGDASAVPVKVSGPMIAGGDVGGDASFDTRDVQWSPDSTRLAYVADQEVDHAESLYVTLATSAAATRVSPAPAGPASLANLAWTPDSTRVVFSIDTSDGGLHVSTVSGPAQPIVASRPGFLSPKFPPLSFAGDQVVVDAGGGALDVSDVRAYDVVTLAEEIVAAPDALPFSPLTLE